MALDEIFPGDSEMARQMRAHDWSATPLGDPRQWPDALKIPLRVLLTSRFEMWLGWGPDLIFFYNDAYLPTLGLKHPAALGKPFKEVWGEVYGDVEDQVERVRHGEATWNKALFLRLERGGFPEETYHSFSYSPLYGCNNRIEGLLCVATEETASVITGRRISTLRRLGEALVGTASEDEIVGAVCSALSHNRHDFPFALLHIAESGRIHACTMDTAVVPLELWSRMAAKATHVGRIFSLEDMGEWPKGAWDVAPIEAIAIEIPGSGNKHAIGTMVLGLNPYRSENVEIASFAQLIAGQISGAIGNVMALRMERQRADRLWSQSRDLMVVLDERGVFQSVNPAWTRILGQDPSEVLGRHFQELMHPDEISHARDLFVEALHQRDLTSYENRFRTASGDYRWISWHTSVEDGMLYAYGRDITEQKRAAEALAMAQDALRQAQKMEAIGQLTGGIAHDFNNLLTGIIGSVEILQRRVAQGRINEIGRYADIAMSSASRAASLTQRLLAFSRRQSLTPKRVDANDLMHGMADLIRRSVGEAIRIDLKLADDLWPTICDPNQLESAILNLALNARDAMPEGGELRIRTMNSTVDEAEAARKLGSAGDFVSISISDTGCGMSPETVAQACEPFFTTKPLGQGTGLGLSMIYGFVQQSQGFMEIRSKLGEGTEVRLHLPRSVASVVPGRTERSIAPPDIPQTGTVLVVEDETAVRKLVVEALQERGYTVLEAEDGKRGLALLVANPQIDCLVTDVGLPGLNGRQLADAGTQDRPGLKVLFVTGYAYDNRTGSNLLDPGMEVMVKPFTVQDLVNSVQRLLSSDGQGQSHQPSFKKSA